MSDHEAAASFFYRDKFGSEEYRLSASINDKWLSLDAWSKWGGPFTPDSECEMRADIGLEIAEARRFAEWLLANLPPAAG